MSASSVGSADASAAGLGSGARGVTALPGGRCATTGGGAFGVARDASGVRAGAARATPSGVRVAAGDGEARALGEATALDVGEGARLGAEVALRCADGEAVRTAVAVGAFVGNGVAGDGAAVATATD